MDSAQRMFPLGSMAGTVPTPRPRPIHSGVLCGTGASTWYACRKCLRLLTPKEWAADCPERPDKTPEGYDRFDLDGPQPDHKQWQLEVRLSWKRGIEIVRGNAGGRL